MGKAAICYKHETGVKRNVQTALDIRKQTGNDIL